MGDSIESMCGQLALTNASTTPIDCCSHPYRVRPAINGFSHGLKSVPRTLFAPVCALVPPFRIHPYPLPMKKTTPKGVVFHWQRMRDSNPRKRSQSPVCYRYTNPLCCGQHGYYTANSQNVKNFFQILQTFFCGGGSLLFKTILSA